MARTTAREEGGSSQELQKLEVYGRKTGLIGGQRASANEFLNYQIEQCFLKIERSLGNSDSNIELMKKKIGELEELQEMIEQRDTAIKNNPQLGLEGPEEEEDVVMDTQNMDKDELEDKLREKRLKKALGKIKTKMCPAV